ncbi:MAG: HAD family hydrolase [Opitutaceae bacterium]
MSNRKVIFLDRDGTINVDTGAVHSLADWRLLDGAGEALRLLQDAGFALAVVTNQSAIGDGRLAEESLRGIHGQMRRDLERFGVNLDAVAHCPHRRDAGCDCRKPRTGLFGPIRAKIGLIDLADSWMVGDKESDIGFGRAIGVRTALIRSRYWGLDTLGMKPDTVVDSLFQFARDLCPAP